MNKNTAIASTFIWIGFVAAISFMESWLKFQAPGVTTSIGVGIGNLVFNALNKVEWTCAIIIVINIYLQEKTIILKHYLTLIICIIILAIQTAILLPIMGIRSANVLKGIENSTSNLHYFFVPLEIIKIIALFIFRKKLLKSK